MPGGRKRGSIPTFPDDSIQSLIGESNWWIPAENLDCRAGRLVWAFIPHVDQLPYVIVPEGRESPTEHRKFSGTIQPLDIRNPSKHTRLPIAAVPCFSGEIRAVYRAKKRPAVVIADQGPQVDAKLTAGKPKWQTAPTLLVAPYYGAGPEGQRAGFNPVFLDRIRKCEYPQFMIDWLPIEGSDTGSILRLDHVQPVGFRHASLEPTPWRLSDDARGILYEWLCWHFEGAMDEDGVLACWIKENSSE